MESVKVGTTFEHKSFINADRTPMVFRVTAVRQGVIYYKPVDGGSSLYAEPGYFNSKVCGQLRDRSDKRC